MIKVRFNLGRGVRYMKWQVRNGKRVEHYDPEKYTLILHNCKLHNQRATAEKIFNGKNKTVCAWVECENITILENNGIGLEQIPVKAKHQIRYNPRELPYWNIDGECVDGNTYNQIFSYKRQLFLL